MREIKEEIGITMENFSYLGKLPKNFFAYPYKNGKMYISVHTFITFSPSLVRIEANPGEVADYFWVPFKSVLLPKPEDRILINYVNTNWIN